MQIIQRLIYIIILIMFSSPSNRFNETIESITSVMYHVRVFKNAGDKLRQANAI